MLIATIILFLVLSALFSGSEIAFISANKLRIELKKKKGARRGAVLAAFYDRPSAFLSTMLVGNNIALVAFTYFMDKMLRPYIEPHIQGELLLLLINTILITLVVLIFGEFVPKTLFRLYADDALYALTYPLRAIELVLSPLALMMTSLSTGLLRLLFKTTAETAQQTFTRLDLEDFVNTSGSDPADDFVDRELFGKALNLKDVKVRECMVPRPEIEHIDVNAGVGDLEQLFRETKLSRILVTQDDIDNVLGYVHHQQLLTQPRTIRNIILDIPFFPEVMRATDVLNRFIKERVNIACVVDEFGGVAGLITMEDILEELFGEIEDEHDQEEHVETQLSPTEFIFSGRLEIDYLNEKYGLDFPEGDFHTLSGYLVMTTEAIPEQGDEIELNGYRFILELVSETKIETVRVVKLAPAD